MMQIFITVLIFLALCVTYTTFLAGVFDEYGYFFYLFMPLLMILGFRGSTWLKILFLILISIAALCFFGNSVYDAFKGFGLLFLGAVIMVINSLFEKNLLFFILALVPAIYLLPKLWDISELL